ncbi:MAG: beta-galactosidase, partial [Bacteroidota bacterium]
MKKTTTLALSCLALVSALTANAQNTSWKLLTDKITTPWAEKINPAAPLPEYPRPQMVRSNNWQNLNGVW